MKMTSSQAAEYDFSSLGYKFLEKLVSLYFGILSRLIGAKKFTFELKGGQKIDFFRIGNGTGEPLLILHGFADMKESYLLPTLILKWGFDLIIPDLPGFSNPSSWNRERFTVENYGIWLSELIDHLNLDKINIVGHSLGGYVAIQLAVTTSQKIKTLTLIDPAGILGEQYQSYYHDFMIGKNIFEVLDISDLNELYRNLFYRVPLNFRIAKPFILKRFIDNFELFEKISHDLFAGIRTFRDVELRKKSYADRTKGLSLRLLVFWGEQDAIFPYRSIELIKRENPFAEIFCMKKTGHCPHMERPLVFALRLRKALWKKVPTE
ncbi:MAG: alpha/beta hydrolase [Oligoflexales bacterium]|nr:alpha/beta hydrolase [Oligoflexales bacterium]